MGLLERWDRRNQRHLEQLPVDAGTDADDDSSTSDRVAAYGEVGLEALGHGVPGLIAGALGIVCLFVAVSLGRRRR